MKVKKFEWQKGWIWDCSKIQRRAKQIEIEVLDSFLDIVLFYLNFNQKVMHKRLEKYLK